MSTDFTRSLVRRFDAFLRRAYGIWEFTQDEKCFFRLGPGRCQADVTLADGTVLHRGDAVLIIHLWNEHIPPLPPLDQSFSFGVHFVRTWMYSMGLLAAYLRAHPEVAGAPALHGVYTVPTSDHPLSQERALQRLGFDVRKEELSTGQAFRAFWEKLYNWAIIWAYNPASLDRRKFSRLDRYYLWIPMSRMLAWGEKAGKQVASPQEV